MTNSNSKSFILHKDSLFVLNEMTNEQAGKFIKAIFEYQISGKLPPLDFGLKMAISPFVNQFKRDQEKYQNIVERNKNNGSKGGRPKNQKKPTGLFGNPEEPKKADNKNDSDNKNDNKELIQSQFEELWNEYKILHTPKGNKEKALDKFKKLLSKNKFEDIIRGTKVYIKNCHTKNIYTKQVISFLNGETWKEYLEIDTQSNTEQHTTDLINKLMNGTLINKIEVTRSNKAKLYTTKKGFDNMGKLDEKLKKDIKNLLTKELGTSGLEFNY